MSAHTPAEWAAVLSGATGLTAALSIPVLLLDEHGNLPHPHVRWLLENAAGDWLLVTAANTRHEAHEAGRRVALNAAAVLLLLSGPKEALR